MQGTLQVSLRGSLQGTLQVLLRGLLQGTLLVSLGAHCKVHCRSYYGSHCKTHCKSHYRAHCKAHCLSHYGDNCKVHCEFHARLTVRLTARLDTVARLILGFICKQDKGGEGNVTGLDSTPGWVRVRWQDGSSNVYRDGAEGARDLVVLGSTTITTPSYTSTDYMTASGKKVCLFLQTSIFANCLHLRTC